VVYKTGTNGWYGSMAKYDYTLSMHVDDPRELDLKKLEFMRYVVEHGGSEGQCYDNSESEIAKKLRESEGVNSVTGD
jgi:hypothetical protein